LVWERLPKKRQAELAGRTESKTRVPKKATSSKGKAVRARKK